MRVASCTHESIDGMMVGYYSYWLSHENSENPGYNCQKRGLRVLVVKQCEQYFQDGKLFLIGYL